MTRRPLLSLLGLVSIVVLGVSMRPLRKLHTTFTENELAHFVDALPIPKHVNLRGKGPQEITVSLSAFSAKLHRDLPAQVQWGYAGTTPGPTIDVDSGQTVRIHWKNDLPAKHLFTLPKNLPTEMDMPGMPGMKMTMPDVRAVTHLHGAVVTESDPMNKVQNNDGWPDAWNVPGESQLAEYGNPQPAMTLWYHDHAMASTGRNVAAGLLGTYIIHDAYEKSLGLPSGAYDIPLMLISKGVNKDGTLFYTDDINSEFWGNVPSVNGKLWPYLAVEPRKYRFRFINASNARAYELKLERSKDGAPGPAFNQIGSDGGFLASTALLNDPRDPDASRLSLMPAERADIIVDFSKFAGQSFTLTNVSVTADDEEPLPEIMQFRVGKTVKKTDPSKLPLTMRAIPRIPTADVSETRRIVFDRIKMPDGSKMLQMNGLSWNDPIEEKPKLGATEVWELANTLIDPHPFHIHMVQFQVLDRRLFDVAEYIISGKVVYIGEALLPEPNETGWKDTVKLLPQMVTRIIMRFSPFPGFYVYHCHILEHEDMDMMRPFEIVGP
jgi:spore coat protein A